MWTWCFRAELYTLFKIDPHRSADVLIEVLGKEFDGVLGCDYFRAYRRYMREFGVVRAVLPGSSDPRREVPDDPAGQAGASLWRAAARGAAGAVRGDPPPRRDARRGSSGSRLELARDRCWRVGHERRAGDAGTAGTWRNGSRSTATSYFTFVTTPGVEPTNNLAEQAIRFVVIDRLITQGTRSEEGERWSERIWTVIATCAAAGADETGHKRNRLRMWTWCFRAELYTLFKIDPTRSKDVLIKVLGTEFEGVLGCDYFSSYRSYMDRFDVTIQFCLAHLIRDVKFLTTLPDARDRAYGERLREELRKLFELIHRRERFSAKQFQSQMEIARFRVVICATTDVPATKHSRNMLTRFEKHGASYFRFMTTPGVEPTNNLAEQAIRFVVIDRLITQGTRSERGDRWCERIWTVIATCTQQGRSVFEYLEAAVGAWFADTEPPMLLPEA